MSVADKADFIRRVFVRYRVLIDFEGEVPARLAQGLAAKHAERETFGEFCERVLGRKPSEVTVFRARSLPANTDIAALRIGAENKAISRALKPDAPSPAAKVKARPAKPSVTEVEAVKEAGRLTRRAAKLERQLAAAEAAAEQIRKSRQRQTYSSRSVDALVAKLETYLGSKVPVHELVAVKVKAALTALADDVPLSEAVWPLVEMTDAVVQLERKAEKEVTRLQALLDKPLADAA